MLLENKERTVELMATKTFITDVSFEVKDADALIKALENENIPKRVVVKDAREILDKAEIQAMFSKQEKNSLFLII